MRAIQRIRISVDERILNSLFLMGQSLIAFTSNLGGLISGFIIAYFFLRIQDPIILMLFPAILTIRGDINGILSSKLGTLLHTGVIKPSLSENTIDFKALLHSIFTFTFVDMLILGLFAFTLNLFFGNIEKNYFFLFLLIPSLTGGISVAISEVITATFAIVTFRRGLDPDILTYPIMSTINDVIITTVYFGVIWFFLSSSYPSILGVIIFSVIAIISLLFASIHYKRDIFVRIFKEATPVIIICLLLGSLSGLILTGLINQLVNYPGILIVYPMLMGTLGNIGAITGATTTTKLFIGEFENKISTIKNAFKSFIPIEAAAFILHIFYALSGFILSQGTRLFIPLKNFFLIVLPSHLLTFPIIFLISYGIAIITFKKGLDPDNFVVPLETSIADLLATVSILLFIQLILG